MQSRPRDEDFYNRVGGERIAARQIDELIGLARGIACDGVVSQTEAEYLQAWLAANAAISGHPVIHTLYARVAEVLADGRLDADEAADLLPTLNAFSNREVEAGETLKVTSLPLCAPAPTPLAMEGRSFCTGTFNHGSRRTCEDTVAARGGTAGPLRRSTDVLVIGVYATESWKHSSFGTKILKAVEMRNSGVPIAIVSEEHWVRYLLLST